MKNNGILEKLEDELARGQVERTPEKNLKNGVGRVDVYKDTIRHPDKRVYESGKIVLYQRSSIGFHMHFDDSEVYTVLSGSIEIDGETHGPGDAVECEKGSGHYCKNLADGKSVIRFVKKRE